MFNQHDWRAACDNIAEELLTSAGVTSPPVDALLVARHLRIELAWDAQLAGRARLQHLGGQPAIFLRPEERAERIQWAAAHELGEVVAWRVAERLDLDAADLFPRQREELANQLARRLLLPTDWLIAAHREQDGDLLGIKSVFWTASHELIAWRMLDLEGGRVVTIVDHGRVSRRRANYTDRCPPAQAAECAAWDTARLSETVVQRRFDAGMIRVWPIHEPDWPREIAVTELDLEVHTVGCADGL